MSAPRVPPPPGSLYVNAGCGDHAIPGFVNLDIGPGGDLQVDVTEGLPFADGSVHGLFSEHLIEHLTQADGVAFLRECRRVLVPGGLARIATPDLDAVVREYASGEFLNPEWLRHGYDWIQNRCEMLNIGMRDWGHRWLYNEEELARLGTMAGLTVCGRRRRGESPHPPLRGLEHRDGSRLVLEFVRNLPRLDHEPLVSIVITAYNPKYFRQALESALAQTYPLIEVVVGDDCPDDRVRAISVELAGPDPRLRYERNDPPLGGPLNRRRCFERARGEYIKFLNDDDLLHPDCVRRMAACLVARPEATLVTSRRRRIDACGEPLPDEPCTEPPVEQDSLITGVSVAAVMLDRRLNFVGEPSTTMFR
ncbi:MAG TPA: glycosyltransferase, partial [Candidatus Polarisedimenticolia bacterium]|nr:glycosyltransferase [Candidatus Polarisedimenticolia bacterium]